MNILQISPQIPYPLLDGGKVGIFNITKHLSLRGHKITMATFLRDRDLPGPSILNEFCDLVTAKHSTENSPPQALFKLFSSDPYNLSKYRSSKFRDLVMKTLREKNFDVVHVDHLHMAPYGLVCKEYAGLPIVLREHNIESTIVDRFAENAGSWPLRKYLHLQARRLRRREAELASRFDCCCVISEEDRQRLANLQPGARIEVVPGGVDKSFFQTSPSEETVPYTMCFFGSLDWYANQDSVRWFIKSVLPLVLLKEPRARFYLVGKSVPNDIQQLQSESVVIRGFVPELIGEVRQYQVIVVPIRIGSGIRLKILESFAMQIPVVSTTVGFEGIPARHGEHLLAGDSPQEFADQILKLFDDPSSGRRLARNAFQIVDRDFRWENIAQRFEELFVRLVRERALGPSASPPVEKNQRIKA